MTIYYLCPDSNSPTGGIRVIYRHVDILNKHGLPAYVLHQKRRFRCTWFENDSRVAYTKFPLGSLASRVRDKIRGFTRSVVRTIPIVDGPASEIGPDDLLVLPERLSLHLGRIGPDIPKVILNQGVFLTFKGYSFAKEQLETPYRHHSVRATLVNSEHCEEYLQYAFPGLSTYRFYLSIDPSQFYYQPTLEKKQICLSRVKNASDALQVINILKSRGVLADFEIIPFINIPQERVASLMRESLIFLNFGNREGFGLPAAEAMACGCIVVGYHGWGGKEFFKPEFSFPIEDGDILGFASTVERIIRAYNNDTNYFGQQRATAAQFIADRYSREREEEELVKVWSNILLRNV